MVLRPLLCVNSQKRECLGAHERCFPPPRPELEAAIVLLSHSVHNPACLISADALQLRVFSIASFHCSDYGPDYQQPRAQQPRAQQPPPPLRSGVTPKAAPAALPPGAQQRQEKIDRENANLAARLANIEAPRARAASAAPAFSRVLLTRNLHSAARSSPPSASIFLLLMPLQRSTIKKLSPCTHLYFPRPPHCCMRSSLRWPLPPQLRSFTPTPASVSRSEPRSSYGQRLPFRLPWRNTAL